MKLCIVLRRNPLIEGVYHFKSLIQFDCSDLNNLTRQENRVFDHPRIGKRLIPFHVHDNVFHGIFSLFRSVVIIIDLSVSKRTDNVNCPYFHLEYRRLSYL